MIKKLFKKIFLIFHLFRERWSIVKEVHDLRDIIKGRIEELEQDKIYIIRTDTNPSDIERAIKNLRIEWSLPTMLIVSNSDVTDIEEMNREKIEKFKENL